MAIRTYSLTLYGATVSGIEFSAGESVLFDLTLQGLADRLPINLTGSTVVLSVAALDIQGNPSAPFIARTATVIAPASGGNAQATITPSDMNGQTPGTYAIGVWLTDGSGNRTDFMPASRMVLLGATG